MREELLRNGFVEDTNGELCIHGLNEMVVYVIPGEHWSVEVFDDSPGTRVLMATIPVSSVTEIETICNNNNILFRLEITQPIFNKLQSVRQLSRQTKDYYLVCDKGNDIYIVTFENEIIFKNHLIATKTYANMKHIAYVYEGKYFPL